VNSRRIIRSDSAIGSAPQEAPPQFHAEGLVQRAHGGRFRTKLFRYPGKGGWTFVEVPERLAPPVTHGWGRTPVHATVDGYEWKTSVWRGKNGRTLLAIPKAARGTKGHGEQVTVQIAFAML